MAKARSRAKTPTRRTTPSVKRASDKTQRARSSAAKKGWATRRANAAKRSASARKGWATRRLNAKRAQRSLTHQRRSDAARKGWETRRARETTPSRASMRGGVSEPDREFPLPSVSPGEPYDDLDDWTDTWDEWDGEYDEYDVESGVEYGEAE